MLFLPASRRPEQAALARIVHNWNRSGGSARRRLFQSGISNGACGLFRSSSGLDSSRIGLTRRRYPAPPQGSPVCEVLLNVDFLDQGHSALPPLCSDPLRHFGAAGDTGFESVQASSRRIGRASNCVTRYEQLHSPVFLPPGRVIVRGYGQSIAESLSSD